MNCEEHNYQYQGVVHSLGNMLSGSGARERVYEDSYYCTKCLDIKYLNRRVAGNNYSKPIEGTMPK